MPNFCLTTTSICFHFQFSVLGMVQGLTIGPLHVGRGKEMKL